ncbi:Pentatricopeptide repeat protein [Pleurostoma richardsiae]|uniref:Pentatricopeptide repeat protein n=1 Tax=Pleurostoma richardsiae TaxID=41990 RepID=A0AA38VUS3_9PEZI|nr:Pentatricopeptide repeat protein [Pleurostoma richardsiae]
MFLCRSCARRASAALSHKVSAAEVRALGISSTTVRRNHAAPAFTKLEEAAAAAGEDAGQTDQSLAVTKDSKRGEKQLAWVVRKHLEHMKDPYKIAQHVENTLRKDRFEEALAVTREASKGAQCVVSWNHLIEYHLQHQRLHAGIKLYNEMKKRAQRPNAQTYTIIFKGCAESNHPKLAVSEALRIYHNMMNDQRLQPNSIHLNAVLRVCASAEDLESMFTLLQTADNPSRQPTAFTYTIILNALRYQWTKPRQPASVALSEEDVKRQKAVAIRRARSIWEEVIRRWRNGQLVIDEELMCAMGRVLLMGETADSKDILALVKQVMNIEVLDGADHTSVEGLMKQLQTTTLAARAAPGKNTLSLVMQALAKTRETSLAPKYWDTFTKTYGVVPDSENWLRYLTVLYLGKASGKTAQVISDMPREFLLPKTFELAFKTCVRDNLNENAFDNANKIFDRMSSTLKAPFPPALRLYLQAATGNHRKFRVMEQNGEPERAKFALGRQISGAVERLWEPMRLATKQFSFPDVDAKSPQQEWQMLYKERMDAVTLVRRVIAATDKIITEGMADPRVVSVLKTRRNILNRYVVRFLERDARHGGQTGAREAMEGSRSPSRRASFD